MKYTRADYENFLNTELQTQLKEYEELVCTKAHVLKERGAVFVGRFIKLQPSGIAIFKVRKSDVMPRKNTFWTASYLIGEMGSFRNWGNNTWASLRKNYQRTCSDALCVWLQKSEESEFCLLGIKNLTLEFAALLEKECPIIAFGPKDPPLQYLLNLITLVRDTVCKEIQPVLDFTESPDNWNPEYISVEKELKDKLMERLQEKDCIIVQGPPGTGKTFRMAQLAGKLLSDNKSVLFTALTNQALMELAKKEDLQPFLKQGRVSKTSLTVDELNELPQLNDVKDNLCNASTGKLTLATFYLTSGWATFATDKPYDYVIVDEASQAFLPMLAASFKLGTKVIWIGDQKQLPPIVVTNEDIINRFQWGSIIKGFETACDNFKYPSYMLSDTFRLTDRAAECTGVFYNDRLHSVSKVKSIPSTLPFLNEKGGPIHVELTLPMGEKAPVNAFAYIYDKVLQILGENPLAEVAILAKFRETVRELQKYFVIKSTGNDTTSDKVRIETVDRVQGLTVDYCFFLIPNTSLRYSLENELFNVATSRAKYGTIIISDNTLLSQDMPAEVRRYLMKAQKNG